MKMRVVLVIVSGSLATACGGGGGKPAVVAGVYPLAFAAEQIAGPEYRVVNLTPAGAEPHDFELSARDVRTVRAAEIVLYLGGGFQPALEDALAGAEGEAVDLLPPGAGDPHVWLDPGRFARIVEQIGLSLGRRSAGHTLATRVGALDREFERGLSDCKRRTIVTSHDAFGYLAERYGLEQIAITGRSPEAEPTPRALENVVERVRASGATTVFFEPLVSPRIAETVARETGAAPAVLDPLESLTDERIEAGEDYLSVMRDNLHALREALGCR